MRFSVFIRTHLEAIGDEWLVMARTLLPYAKTMSDLALGDHCRPILLAIVQDMETSQTEDARARKSKGGSLALYLPQTAAAAVHGALRQSSGFTLVQLLTEFRALRAGVLALWRRSEGTRDREAAIEEIARFNEGVDQAITESVEQYERAVSKSRDTFLGVLGHDLRSPLAAIEMSNQILARSSVAEPGLQAVQRISRCIKVMNRLLTDLLEYSRSRLGGGIPVKRSDCDLRQICEEAVDAIRTSHPDRQCLQDLSGDLRVRADLTRMQQVLSNLLDNAVQYGDPKAPISLTARGETDVIVLTIANTGTPIPADALQSIFEPLVQLPNGDQGSHELARMHIGLGLFIVREIVHGHYGNISVRSSPEQGTSFAIRLPGGS